VDRQSSTMRTATCSSTGNRLRHGLCNDFDLVGRGSEVHKCTSMYCCGPFEADAGCVEISNAISARPVTPERTVGAPCLRGGLMISSGEVRFDRVSRLSQPPPVALA
jgi:hypothetical protein